MSFVLYFRQCRICLFYFVVCEQVTRIFGYCSGVSHMFSLFFAYCVVACLDYVLPAF